MAAKRRVMIQAEPAIPAATVVSPVEAATTAHAGIPSPAAQLQARLDAALALPADEPSVEKWSAAVRLGILAAGAVGSWAMLLTMVSYLI